MAIEAARLQVTVGADTSPAEQDIRGFRSRLNQTAADLGRTGAFMSAAVSAPIIAIGADALRTAAKFQQGMAQVGALSGATASELDALTSTAEQLGRTTSFSASEAAEGMSFLAMAGFDVNDTIDAMPGLLAAAAAGQTDLATTADIVSNVLSGMGWEAERTGELADIMTATFTRSNTSLEQLGSAMSFVAPQSANLGISMEETAAAIGLLSDAGIQGTRAGTGLNAVLSRLGAPTSAAADAMAELGVNVFDAEGNMRDLPGVLNQFERALDGMTQQQRTEALSQIFDTRALTSFNVLLSAGSENLEGFAGSMDSVKAADVAADQLNTFEGQVKLLNSALEGLKITVVRAVLPGLQDLISRAGPMITHVTEWFESLDRNAQLAGFAFLGIAAAAGPVMLALAGVAAAVSFLLTPIGAVVAASAVLGAAWVGDFAGMRTATMGFVDTIRGLVTGFQNARDMGLEPFRAAVFAVQNELEDAFQRISEIMAGIAAGDLQPARDALNDAFDAITSFDFAALASTLGTAGTDVANAILNSFKQIDLPALRDDIISKLGLDNFQLFASDEDVGLGNLPAQMQQLGVAFGAIREGAGDLNAMLPGMNEHMSTGAIAVAAMREAAERLSNLDWATIQLGGQLLVTEVQNQLTNIDWSGAANGLRLRIQSAFRGIDWQRLSPIDISPLVNNLQSNFGQAQQQLNVFLAGDNPLTRFFERARGVVDTVSELMSGIGGIAPAQRFERVVSAVLATVSLVGETRFDLIQTAARHIATLVTSILDFGTDIVDSLDSERIAEVLGGVAKEWSDQFAATFEGTDLFDMAAAAGKLGSTFVSKLGEILSAPNFGEDVGKAIGNATVALAQAAGAIVSGLASELDKNEYTEFDTASKTFVESFVSGLISAIPEIDYSSVAGQIVDAIVDAIVAHVMSMSPLSFFGPAGAAAEAGLESAGVSVPTLDSEWWPEIPSPDSEWWPEISPLNSEWWPSLPVGLSDWDWPSLPESMTTWDWPGVPAWLSDWTWPSVPAWLSDWTWPGLPESMTTWDWPMPQALILWQWPAPNDLLFWDWPSLEHLLEWDWPSLATLTEWDWPSLATLTTWDWPSLAVLTGWDWPSPSVLLNWSWPSLPTFTWPRLPTWTWPSIPMPAWVDWLLNWGGGGDPDENATGTKAFAGGLTWVGERGPELVRLPRGSTIHTNRESMAMAGGDVHIHMGGVTISNDMDLEQVANEIVRKIQRQRRA